MQPSVLRNVLFSFLGAGVLMASIFPFYAAFFVEWKPGMQGWFVFGCVIAGLVMGTVNYWVMNAVLVSKLKHISQVASAIANRDLSFTCAMESHDTLGEIIKSFNDMAAALRELIASTSHLSSEVRNDTGAISAQSGQIHDRVDQMNHRTSEIAAAISHLERAIADISARTLVAAECAGKAKNTALEGVGVAQESLAGMERIHDTVNNATTSVEKLGRSSQEVGAIVAVIKEIADQTNLLALNAAIEAARAGEQGRGFAVVADEVRKLAEKTTQATSEISQMIQNIQSETRHAIDAIGLGMAEASAGVGHAREAGSALETIAGSVNEVTTQVGEITSAAASQRDAADQVRASIEAIEQLNGETLNDAEIGVNLTSVLAGRANSLDEAVKSFKLN
jgi:methyl-accepting chemotaxis protein